MIFKFLAKGSSAVLGNLVSFAGSLVAVKIFALFLGPTGQGYISIIRQLFQSLNSISSLNCQSAVTEGVSTQPSKESQRAFYTKALLLIFISTSIAVPLAYIANTHFLSINFLDRPINAFALYLVVLLASFNVVFVGLLNGTGNVNAIIRGTLLNGGAQLTLAAPSALILKNYELDLFVYYLLSVQTILSIYYATQLWKRGLFPKFITQESLLGLWTLARPTAALFISGASTAVTLLGIRLLISHTEGYHEAGLFDAAWTVANTNATLVLTSFSVIYFPALLRSNNNAEKLEHYKAIFRLSLMIFGPLLVALSGVRLLAFYILFSKEFHEATDILKYLLIGDMFKSLVYTCGYLALSLRRYRHYAIADCSWNIVFFVISYFVIKNGNYHYIGIAYAACYAVLFGIYGLLVNRWLTWRPSIREIAALMGFLTLLGVSAAAVPNGFAETASLALPTTASAVALSLCLITKEERRSLLTSLQRLKQR